MPDQTEIRMIEVIFPELANHYGTLFGGHALALMAKAAFAAAVRHAGTSVVMARAEEVDFSTPVRLGDLLELAARVTRTGRCSMTVEVQGTARASREQTARLALSGRFEMVAIDAEGQPRPISQNAS